MKRFGKILINALVVVMLAVSCFGLVGCKKDIKTVELTISLYDYEHNKWYDESEVAITVDLYRHLAPNTVDKMVEYVNEGYYDGAIFYKSKLKTGTLLSQVMFGDLKVDEHNQIVLNDIKPMIDGEFEYGNTKGSDLVNEKGSVGLWRTWNADDDSNNDGFKTNASYDTGRATWFMPEKANSSYDKYFCVFGKLDLEDESTSTGLDAIIDAFVEEETYQEYVIYYTGEYDYEKVNENFGLEYHCVLEEDFDADEVEDLFEAEGDEYACYNYYTIQVPVTPQGNFATVVKSVKII